MKRLALRSTETNVRTTEPLPYLASLLRAKVLVATQQQSEEAPKEALEDVVEVGSPEASKAPPDVKQDTLSTEPVEATEVEDEPAVVDEAQPESSVAEAEAAQEPSEGEESAEGVLQDSEIVAEAA